MGVLTGMAGMAWQSDNEPSVGVSKRRNRSTTSTSAQAQEVKKRLAIWRRQAIENENCYSVPIFYPNQYLFLDWVVKLLGDNKYPLADMNIPYHIMCLQMHIENQRTINLCEKCGWFDG